MRKVLLGTTALAAMGLLVSGVAQAEEEAAQAEVGPVSVGVGGYLHAAVGFVGGDSGENKHSPAFGQSVNITVSGSTTLDNGITVGVVGNFEESEVEIEEGEGGRDNSIFDEYYSFFSGPFGEIKVGVLESAAQQMTNFAPNAAGIFGVNSPHFIFAPESYITTYTTGLGEEDSAKLVYFTPAVNGFRLGASYAPSDTEKGQYGGNSMDSGGYKNHWSVGAEYVADFSEASLRAMAGYEGYEYDGMCDSTITAKAPVQKTVNLSVREKVAKIVAAVDKNDNGIIDGHPGDKNSEMYKAVKNAEKAWNGSPGAYGFGGGNPLLTRAAMLDEKGKQIFVEGEPQWHNDYDITWRRVQALDTRSRNIPTASAGSYVSLFNVPDKYTGGEVQNCQPDALRYGATISAGDFAFGGGVLHSDVSNEHQRIAYDLGLSYSAGAYTLGLQWAHAEEELVTGSIDAMGDMVMGKGDKDTDRYAINGTYVLGPGISLQAQADTGTVAKPGMEEDDWTQVMLGTSISF